MDSKPDISNHQGEKEKKGLRIAIIGQSQFAVDVYRLLIKNGHTIVAVFTIPDSKTGKVDLLATAAISDNITVFKFARWRSKGIVLDDVFNTYKSLNAELNVLPYCSQFIPMEVIECPFHKSIIYHPSILPLHRGASAINWTLIHGDKKAGLTVFWADDGLDTGPILLQRSCRVLREDTVDSLYNRFLYPEGVKAVAESVRLIEAGEAPRIVQSEVGASYEAIMKKEIAKLDCSLGAQEMHNFIRGCDTVPAAWIVLNNEKVSLFGSSVWKGNLPLRGRRLEVEGGGQGIVHHKGLVIPDEKGSAVLVTRLLLQDGKMIEACMYGEEEQVVEIQVTSEEEGVVLKLKEIWSRILGIQDIDKHTDFFKSGGGSMQVVRLIEEVRSSLESVNLLNQQVYMASTFQQFLTLVIMNLRGISIEKEFTYDAVELQVGRKTLRVPHELFIRNTFLPSHDNSTFSTINPYNEQVICQVSMATTEDVDYAVEVATEAFEGEWSKMNARDRGKLMYRLADVMDECKEELAMLESVDSGAVYTLALKTHIGMSIESFRYFAGWCDKIHGKTIPINHARPNKNLALTKKIPIGVVGIITPWNYPLMMLAWKMAACLAAGNTVILKPAQVTPLTSLKFCELVVKAGFPPGVVNVLPGSGRIVGQALADHPGVRKIAFTGSTQVGKTIMQSCGRSNVKKVSLELGGKSPLIVCCDADLADAVLFGCSAVFFNKGENCIAAGRIFVEENIHDAFLQRVLEEVKKMKIGDPLDTATDHGPQNHLHHLESLLKFVRRGVEEGATLVHGGSRLPQPGFFFPPTIFTDVQDDMFIAKEESFGPIMVISKFSEGDYKEVIERANNTEFALASGVFSSNISKALQIADGLEAGNVFVNTYNKTDVAVPFGGFKQSGFGKDLGEDALNEYLLTKTIVVQY